MTLMTLAMGNTQMLHAGKYVPRFPLECGRSFSPNVGK